MKRIGWLVALILMALNLVAWQGRAADRKLTVQELRDRVAAAQLGGKSDADLAKELSGMELSEELPASEMGRLVGMLPGPLSTEQLYVLEVRNAALQPPPENLPAKAAPEEAEQHAMLARAREWAAKVYAQLPPLSAQCLIARFQDGYTEAVTTAGAKQAKEHSGEAIPAQGGLDVRLINKHLDKARFVNGVEVETVFTETAEPGENGVTALVEEPLSPSSILQEAMDSRALRFLRWESVNGLRLAVFSFAVDKKKTQFGLAYRATAVERKALGMETYDDGATTTSTVVNNVVSRSFHHRGGYGGEVFIEPDSGMVLRTITEAAFKPDDIFHSETIRTDYAPLPVEGKTRVVPVRRFKITEFVPGDRQTAKKDAVRHNFVTEDFKDFQLADATATLN
jgi:hypothetical protein